MRANLVLFIVAFFFVGHSFAISDIEYWESSKGAKVYFIQKHNIPMVDIAIAFPSGSREDGDKLGLASLTASMLIQGSDGLSTDQINSKLESTGAIVASDANHDFIEVTLRSLTASDQFDAALDIVSKIVARPNFQTVDLQREQSRVKTSIRQTLQRPQQIAIQNLFARLYGKHPYAVPVIGREEALSSISVDDLRRFHDTYFVPYRAVITIVGDLSRKQAEATVEKLIGLLPQKEEKNPIVMPVWPIDQVKGSLERINFTSQQTHILAYTLGVERGHPDYLALTIGNYILGGSGLVSRLFNEIREKRGLSYSTHSFFWPLKQPGPFIVLLQTKNDKAKQATAVLQNTLQQFLTDGISAEELRSAKNHLLGNFALRLASTGDLLGVLSAIGRYGLPLDYLVTYADRVQSVSVEQVQLAFQKHVAFKDMNYLLVGPVQDDSASQ